MRHDHPGTLDRARRDLNQPLCGYLDHYLSRPDLGYDQGFALGALLHLDDALGSESASRFVAPSGPWHRWVEGPPRRDRDPQNYRQFVHQLCAFADESAEVFALLEREL
ncbi:DUF6000 family protein [Streptomyces sp. NPDC053726]|uniref:DUF6000 family protein n=1 Tax=Streptomyces sp. NPDC053726 TaxID=3365713 RepID=UPI0037D8CF0C